MLEVIKCIFKGDTDSYDLDSEKGSKALSLYKNNGYCVMIWDTESKTAWIEKKEKPLHNTKSLRKTYESYIRRVEEWGYRLVENNKESDELIKPFADIIDDYRHNRFLD